jgi:hypothetical protein
MRASYSQVGFEFFNRAEDDKLMFTVPTGIFISRHGDLLIIEQLRLYYTALYQYYINSDCQLVQEGVNNEETSGSL